MRILLTNHHLRDRGGSELYTIELAETLRALEHDVAVFTFGPPSEASGEPGIEIAERLRITQVSVLTPDDRERIVSYCPDVIEVHHAPCLYFLREIGVRSPAIFSSLGPRDGLEAPPTRWDGVVLGLAVSEEVKDVLANSDFGRNVPVEIVRNWFDDRGVDRPLIQTRSQLKWAVVTNHLDAQLTAHLMDISTRVPDFSWHHIGLPENSQPISPALLRSFDGVITIGRTAILAAALGIPCLLYDVHGCDGLMSAARLGAIASKNFSGRLFGHRPSKEELEALLLSSKEDLVGTRDAVWKNYRLTKRAKAAVERYERVLALSGSSGADHTPAL